MEAASATKTNTPKTRSDKAVQGTNDSSILSKSSSSAAGYFSDPFLQHFAAKKVRRAPLINRGYYIRSWIVDHVLHTFLKHHQKTQKQIISLGCGFDTLYFRLKSSGLLTNTVVAEVDFPELMKKKHTLIKNKPALKELLGEPQQPAINSPHIELCCTDYKMLGVDLTQHNLLEAALRLSGIDFDLPTLILSECVLTYMTKRCSSEVIKWAADTFQENSVFVLYEQILPNDSFGLFMQKHYNVIGAPLKCINSFPTLESQKNRALSLGWSWCEAFDMNQIYHRLIPPDERRRVEHIETFDEYEEWHLKCAHYFVLCASSNQCPQLVGDVRQISAQPYGKGTLPDCSSVSEISAPLLPVETNSTLQRFSHSSALVSNRYLITIGGFGMQDGKHQRVSDVAVTDVVSMKTQVYKPREYFEFPRMHHTSVVLKDGSVLVICGRNSPSSLCQELVSYKLTSANNSNNSDHEQLVSTPPPSATPRSTPSSSALSCSPPLATATSDSAAVTLPVVNTTLGLDDFSQQTDFTSHDSLTGKGDHVLNKSNNCVVNDCNSKPVCDGCDTNVAIDKSNSTVCDKPNSAISRHATSKANDVGLSVINNEPLTDSNNVDGERNTVDGGSDKHNSTVSGNVPCNKANSTVSGNVPCNKANSTLSGSGVISTHLTDDLPSPVCYESQVDCSGDGETSDSGMQLECRVERQTGDVPSPRWRHATAVINIAGKEYVFLYGGRTSTEVALDDGYLLDTDEKMWKKLSCKGDLPGCRQSHTLSTWSPGKLVLAGGLNEDLTPQFSLHILHLDTLVWQRLDTAGTQIPRYSHTSHTVDNLLVLVGGVNCSSSCPGISVVNLASAVVQHFSLPVPDKDHLLLCNKHTSVLQDGRLILVGGGGNCFSFGTLLNRSPVVLDISQCFGSSN